MRVPIGGVAVAALAVAGQVRAEGRAAVAALRDMALEVAMITGDACATAIAADLGIDLVEAEVAARGQARRN